MATAWRNRIVGTDDLPPDQLLANPKNWRTHPPQQRDALRGSLTEVGWVQQVMVNKVTGFVVDGHARVEEAISRGEPTVPVLYVELTPEEEAVVLATLDPISAMASQDEERLRELLAEVRVDDAGLQALLDGLAEREQHVGKTDPDFVPDVPEEPYVKVGDLWALDDHRLVCGDSTKADDVKRLDAVKVDCVWTDPPYGMEYQSRVDEDRRKPWGLIANDDLSGMPLRTFLAASVPAASHRYICTRWESYVDFAAALGTPRSVIIWDKGSVGLGKGYRRQHEIVLFYGSFNSTTESDVWRLDRATDYQHPTQKPVELVVRALTNSTKGRDVIYDPFVGSGTTIIAAEQLGRRCYAMEIDPRYAQVAIERWQAFTGKEAQRVE